MTVAEFQLAGGPKAPSSARELLCEAIGTQVPPALVDTARLLVSELVTNAVIHGGVGADDTVTLRAALESDGLRVEICHRGPEFVVPDGDPDLDSPGGLGLFVVEQMSDEWGIETGGEICVWFKLARRTRVSA